MPLGRSPGGLELKEVSAAGARGGRAGSRPVPVALARSDGPPGGNGLAGVLEDIGAQAHRDFFGFPAQRFGGTGRAQCHGDRFGAPDGGDHLPVDEVYDLVAFGLR